MIAKPRIPMHPAALPSQRLVVLATLPERPQPFDSVIGWLVIQGWAVAYRRYSRDYVRAEDRARAGRRGVWSGQFEMPWEWRAARR